MANQSVRMQWPKRHRVVRTRFGDDPRFLHSKGQKGLPERVVDFVSASVIEVFSL